MDVTQCTCSAAGRLVVGFAQEVALVVEPGTQRVRLPESPLAKLLRQPQEHTVAPLLPRLSIRTPRGDGYGSDSPTSQASAPSSLLGAGSVPIPIPDSYRVSHSLEGQIMEDLSLDAAAQCQLRSVERDRPAPNSLIGAASPCRSEAPDQCPSMESDVEAHMETLAVAQLRNLEAKLGDEDSHMVQVVEAMRLAAEDHKRLLLDCAILRARACSDDCVFDMDADCPYRPAADLRPWVSV